MSSDKDRRDASDPGARADDAGRQSVRRQLVTMLGLAIAPALVLSIAYGVRTYADEKAALDRAFTQAAVVAAQSERDALVAMRATLETLAVSPALNEPDAPGCDAALRAVRAVDPRLRLITFSGVDGMVRCASDPEALGVSFADSDGFRTFMAAPRFDIAFLPRGRVTGEPALVAFTPVLRDGVLQGALSTSMPARMLRFLMHESEPVDRVSRRAVVDGAGALLVASEDTDTRPDWLPAPARLAAALESQAQTFEAPARDGAQTLYATAPLLDGRAWLLAAADRRTVFQPAFANVAAPVLAPLVILLIAVGVAYWALDRLVVRHLHYLGRLTRAYGAGRLDLQPRKAANMPRELAALADDLAAMAQRLKLRETQLKDAAETQRVLLLEVYHRVKNNLQMISSLLNMQARRAVEEHEKVALRRISGRVHGMALVHEKLYQSDDLNCVRLDALLQAIVTHLTAGGAAAAGVTPRVTLTLDALTVGPDRATPLAMFFNEALSNAIAYVRPGPDERAVIDVALRVEDDGAFTLRIANTAGAVDAAPAPSGLGSQLMDGFASQLRGVCRRHCEAGWYETVLTAPPAQSVVNGGAAELKPARAAADGT